MKFVVHAMIFVCMFAKRVCSYVTECGLTTRLLIDNQYNVPPNEDHAEALLCLAHYITSMQAVLAMMRMIVMGTCMHINGLWCCTSMDGCIVVLNAARSTT